MDVFNKKGRTRMKEDAQNNNLILYEIKKSLNAILMILVRNKFSDDNKKLNIGEAARFLHSVGLPPSEIATLLGKKKATEIAPHLYKKLIK